MWKWCKRYVNLTFIAVFVFALYLFFFNENSFMQSYRYNQQIEALKAEIQQNRDTMEYYESLNNLLNTDPETMEKIVREHYHMQRTSEDVYIVD